MNRNITASIMRHGEFVTHFAQTEARRSVKHFTLRKGIESSKSLLGCSTPKIPGTEKELKLSMF